MTRESAEEVRRLFLGPFLPSPLVQPDRLPVVPHIPGAIVELVHSHDVAEAHRLAATCDVRGAFNVAAEPEIDGWRPTRDGIETIRELLQGLSDRTGGTTPPLRAGDRAAEIAAGVGREPV